MTPSGPFPLDGGHTSSLAEGPASHAPDFPSRSSDFLPLLRKIGAGPKRSKDLTMEEAEQAAGLILDGIASPAQVGAFLIALRVKEETPQELAGFTRALRSRRAAAPGLAGPVIECAAAYDGRVRSIPVGVAAAAITARAGITSLFHGVAGLGRSGLGPADCIRYLDLLGSGPMAAGQRIVYVDQTSYCPQLARLVPLRNSLGLRTAFNTAEKLVGLSLDAESPGALIVGVFHGGYLEKVAEAARLAGLSRVAVIQGPEGSDDLHITRDSRVCELRDGDIISWSVDLEALGLPRHPAAALYFHEPAEAFLALRAALNGTAGPLLDSLALNVGFRLYLLGLAASLAQGVSLGRLLLSEHAADSQSDEQ